MVPELEIVFSIFSRYLHIVISEPKNMLLGSWAMDFTLFHSLTEKNLRFEGSFLIFGVS